MRICILVEDSFINESRSIAKSITQSPTLTIPLSANGELPITHWFCSMNVDEKSYAALLRLKKNSIIEESGPKEFLLRKKLQIIK